MKYNRFWAAALAAALTCSLCLPVSAAQSSFSDIGQDTVAVNADILRLMGVVTGTGDNRFNPEGELTRAEFCVMVTKFIQRGDEVSRYATRTIFNDVTGKHWARGYINLMATPGPDGAVMISGIGNGGFAPDQKVTVAQAVTVLLRVLNYSGKETGFIWPQSYMDFASSIRLTDGVPQDANTVLTRAQAAQLFVNALGCPTKSGIPYYKTLGNTADNTILLAVSVTSEDGSSNHAIRTSLNGESFLPAAGAVSPTALQGKRGTLVLNDREEIVSFYPDDSNSISMTLSDNAQPSYLTGANGVRYTISSSTLLYTADHPAGISYIEGYTALRPGTQVTLFTQSGKVIAIYAAGSTSSGASAVVVTNTINDGTFYRLTGGASNYTILKGGQNISLNDIKPYDVVTYDSLSNTLVVSDLRLRGTFEDTYPNAQAPQTITALGREFEVLDSAWTASDNAKIGDNISLLLTADGKVAAIVNPHYSNSSTAYGLATDAGVEVFLPNGSTMLIPGTFAGSRDMIGRIVKITNYDNGIFSGSELSSKSIPGDFSVASMTLGEYPISSGVHIYDQASTSTYVPVSLGDLKAQTVDSSDIKTYHLNTSGYVDCIILDNVTGNAYQYGMCHLSTIDTDGDGEPDDRFLTLKNGTNTGIVEVMTNFSFKNGQFYGVAQGADGKIKSIVSLERLTDISPSDFFDTQGVTYLEHSGKVYPVSSDVVCYKTANKLWFSNETGSARLAGCKAFSSDLTAYYDPYIGYIRVVCAN